MNKKWKFVAGTAMAAAAVVLGWNLLTVTLPVAKRLANDSRNKGVSLWAYHQHGIKSGTLVMDLRGIDDQTSALDVFRSLLQGAEALKDSAFDTVILARSGQAQFLLDGQYFQELGQTYAVQNPVYTLRTLPEHLYRLDGTEAFTHWSGGLLGVMLKQMEDVGQFFTAWLGAPASGLDDLAPPTPPAFPLRP